MSTFRYQSDDGTWLKGWRNEGTGPAVALVPGCGTVPSAWPSLADPGCGFAAVTHYQRGVMGSDRPADPRRIRVEHHAEDLVALLDHAGLDRVLLAGWSLGVNVAFEVARSHPDRVAGILAVAGVPGGTFHSMAAPLPARLRRPAGLVAVHGLRMLSPLLNGALALVPPGSPAVATVAGALGLVGPGARTEHTVAFASEFARHDWTWFATLALAIDAHERMALGDVRCPVTVLAGLDDVVTNAADSVAATADLPDVRVRLLPGTHFLPLEHPEAMVEELHALVARTTAHDHSGPDLVGPGRRRAWSRRREAASRRALHGEARATA